MGNPQVERFHPEPSKTPYKLKACNMNKINKTAFIARNKSKIIKTGLMLTGILLLIFGLIWMTIQKDTLQKEAAFPAKMVELHEMKNPVYTGQDEHGKPYIIKATKGKLLNPDDEKSLIHIDLPWGQFASGETGKVHISAAQGLYDSKARVLTLKDNVRFVTNDGYDFTTASAILYLNNASAEGNQRVTGKGPQGIINAEGFRIKEKGAIVTFIGNSRALLSTDK